MSRNFDINLMDNHFDEKINKRDSSEDFDDYTVISIKNSVSLENLLRLEKRTLMNAEVQTDLNIDVEKIPLNEHLTKIKELEVEINTLKIKNASLERNLKDISSLINSFMKIDVSNPKIEQIRNQLIILLNREIRMHHAVPFMSFWKT